MEERPTLLPTPSGLPTPQNSKSSLPTEINTATRKQHTELNRLIIDRLPLALPPHTSSHNRYATGIAAFLQIYTAFEQAWDDFALENTPNTENNADLPHNEQVASWITTLRPANLPRRRALERDAAYLHAPLDIDWYYRDELIHVRVTQICRAKPHALVAYSWVMYMAIFSGGRWIRQQLASAGPGFWGAALPSSEKQNTLKMPGFQFLSFPGEEDGEDIKREYKARLAEGDGLLGERERGEVVEAAGELFEMCIHLVESLDAELARREAKQTVVRVAKVVGIVLVLLGVWALLGSGRSGSMEDDAFETYKSRRGAMDALLRGG